MGFICLWGCTDFPKVRWARLRLTSSCVTFRCLKIDSLCRWGEACPQEARMWLAEEAEATQTTRPCLQGSRSLLPSFRCCL